MATQIVELTGDEAALLRSLDKVIQKQLEYERKLRDTAEQGDAAGVALRDALGKVQVESDKALNGLLRELKTLGPEGSNAAAALRAHLQDAGKAGHRSMDDVLAQIRLIDPEAATAAEQAAASFEAAGEDTQAVWREQLQLLRSLGPEGAAVAAQIETDMKAAAAEAAGGMEGVLARLQEIDPTVAAAAARVKTELAEAAQYSEREFTDVLDELRRIGPVGRQAAAELRQHLVEAGKIAERSMDQIIATRLDALDPETAKAARAIIANVENAAKKGESAFAKLRSSAVAEIGAIVTAYAGVDRAIDSVNAYLKTQQDLLRETKDIQLELAKAQQEAAKNLAGLAAVERSDLLRQAVPEIAAATGFPDLAEITQAIGAVSGAGVSDTAKVREAVEQSARIERLTPERLDATATTAALVQQQAGLPDIRQAIALTLTAGAESLTTPENLVNSLPGAVGALVATVPEQDREMAARQGAALYAQFTQAGVDTQGRSTATFMTDFGTRLMKLFTDMSDERVKARSQIELIDRKIAKGSDTELDRLNRDRLGEYLQATEGLQDPKTLFGRLEVVQESEALQRQFVGEGFGEKQFQTGLMNVLDPLSEFSGAVEQSAENIVASNDYFEREASQLVGLTPQLSLAAFDAGIAASRNAQLAEDNEGAALIKIREAAANVFETTRPQGFEGFADWMTDFSASGGLRGSTAAEEALSLTDALLNRAAILRSDGLQPGDQEKLNRIDTTIDQIYRFLERQGQLGALDPEGVSRARRRALSERDDELRAGSNPVYAENFQRMAELLEKVVENTSREAVPKPQQPAAIAPALGNVQP